MKAAVPHLERSRGCVLVVSSVVAVIQAPGLGGYAPSKAAVEAFADVLRVEASALGLDVGAAYLSLVDTEMLRGFDRSPVGARLHRCQLRLGGRPAPSERQRRWHAV